MPGLGAVPSAVVSERKLDGGVGLQDAQLSRPAEAELLAGAVGAGAVGVDQGVAGQGEQVVHVGECHLAVQVAGVAGVGLQPAIDVAQERVDVDVVPVAGLSGDCR